ncbi:23859_t:CDS:2, partial [Racocetra persica]
YPLRCSVPVEMFESVKTHEAGVIVKETGVRLDMFKRERVTFRLLEFVEATHRLNAYIKNEC